MTFRRIFPTSMTNVMRSKYYVKVVSKHVPPPPPPPSTYYIDYPNKCMVLFGVTQCNNVLRLRNAIFTNESLIFRSDRVQAWSSGHLLNFP